jgi:phosphocarrier protein
MPTTDIVISNKLGLHARAAAKLTQLASQFACEVFIIKAGQRVNAKSIMGVMMLAAGIGTTVTIETNGPDAVLVGSRGCARLRHWACRGDGRSSS